MEAAPPQALGQQGCRIRLVLDDQDCSVHDASSTSRIFPRSLASGNGPCPAETLSAICAGLEVAGIGQVTAGWPRIHARKN
jgi:hypothetical protein